MRNVLLIADTHVRSYNEFSKPTPSGLTDLLEEQDRWFAWVASLIPEYNIELLIHLGDVFHSDKFLRLQELYLVNKWFRRYEEETEFLVQLGNHDVSDGRGKIHGLSASHVLDSYGTFSEKPEIVAIPWGTPYTEIDLKGRPMAISHIELNGAFYDAVRVSRGYDFELERKQFVFAAHYHTPQQLGNVVIVGSLGFTSFSDVFSEIPRGVVLVTLDEKKGVIDVNRLANPETSYYITVLDADDEETTAESVDSHLGAQGKSRGDCYLKVHTSKRLSREKFIELGFKGVRLVIEVEKEVKRGASVEKNVVVTRSTLGEAYSTYLRSYKTELDRDLLEQRGLKVLGCRT